MSIDTPRLQESTGTVTGPYVGRDRDGDRDHRYWRCERCGLESTDRRLREGCFRCSPSATRRERRIADEECRTPNGECQNGEQREAEHEVEDARRA